MNDLSDDEKRALREMIEREKAVSWLWGWIKSFLFVAVGGLLSIWTLIELWRNSK